MHIISYVKIAVQGPRSPHQSNACKGRGAFSRGVAKRSQLWHIRPATEGEIAAEIGI